jgi:hypothetical protein
MRAYESKRDLASELLESVQQMKAGKTKVVHSAAVQPRERPQVSRAAILSQVCELLAGGDKLAASAHLMEHYPPPSGQTLRRSWRGSTSLSLVQTTT